MALPAIVEEAARCYRAALEAELPGRVARVAVFGSMARGDAHEDSDLDVLVLLSGPLAFRERARAIDVGAEVGLARGLVVSPLGLSQAEWGALVERERLLPREIDREGVDV